jgi:hypothetical protein
MKVTLQVPKPVSAVPGLAFEGAQILYVPPHLQYLLLEGKPVEINYPNGAQPGFIYSGPTPDGDYFCRYWQCYDGVVKPELRTLANSERVSGNWIFPYNHFDADVVSKALVDIWTAEENLGG